MDQNKPADPASGARFDALVRSLLPTFGHTGRDALVAMIEQLGTTLHVRRAHVSVPAPDRPGWFQMLSCWPQGREPSDLFPLPGTASLADLSVCQWRKISARSLSARNSRSGSRPSRL